MAKIDEVAKAAGVSISTVSYALSGKRPISADTRARIDAAVRELDYRPNAGARMLAGSRTSIFALTEPFRPDTHAPTHMSFVLAASIAARRNDYDILLLTEEEASSGMRRVASSGLVDGVLVLDVAPDDERVALARRIAIPTVFIGVPDDHAGLTCVDLDFERAATLAVRRLADAQHRVVGLVGQPAIAYENSNFPPRVRRGFDAAARELGLDAHFRSTGSNRPDAATTRRGIAEMIDAGVTGFLVHASEEATAAVLAEVTARGLSIPADVSLISVASSFDASALAIAVDDIPLVPQRSCDLAVDLALRALEDDPPKPRVHLIEPQYHSRGSVGPVRPTSGERTD
ncbi:LacI family DNA-binding transcriptional regulator [Microbacterium pygmaeum]|uniref:DNA-binding transcriptional regulator, LacI/PurR family n=1 Tax=Microbacterium pygmaeum TaxID=370764 RepID=A0A1G7WT75_9MICO|nr:LacI family DNA-binding transcriptional regulator [Microbacterium pygmaeum]SDG75118.1 DNA-binding transcriptional regulator, LacI/PurR family [Microbacterium pygmaeum]